MRLAAHVVGFYDLEVLTELATGGFSAGALAQAPPLDSGAIRFPLGIAVGDVDGDAKIDVFVSDPMGNWVARGQGDGTFVGTPADPALASFPPTSEVQLVSMASTASGVALVGVGGWQVYAASRQGDAATWSSTASSGDTVVNITSPVCLMLARDSSDAGAVDQLICPTNWRTQPEQFFWYDLTQVAQGIVPTSGQSGYTIAPPYVVPFDSLDHPKRLPLAGCDGAIAGIGVFSEEAVGVPRHIQRFTLGPSPSAVSELQTPFDVITFDVVEGVSSDAIVGVIGTSAAGAVFAAYRVTGCDDWAPLGSVATDFDWRPAPAPGFGEDAVVPKTNGVQLLGWRMQAPPAPGSTGYRFVHYDGYTVRIWTLGVTNGTTSATFDATQFTLHTERTDLVAP